ncbi:uncharacterized protein DFL_000762 [Arthrobotrys flagrans]|uniref:Uncharacterized protein n=1 Tax=Arthrobotrys flagrans TaxID=97331 RepID=A0A437AEM6_ARTFL|nr:hypothetical protein DFL_000762 [Arthrobotrys flagrans]
MQVCDTDGVQIVIDNDAAVRYLLGLLKRDSDVKMTVYAVDTISPGETHRAASPATAAEFDPSATPIYDTACRTPRFVSPTPSEKTVLGGFRGRAQQRTPDRFRFSDDRSVSPMAQPREPSRDRGYESAPSSYRSSHHRSRSPPAVRPTAALPPALRPALPPGPPTTNQSRRRKRRRYSGLLNRRSARRASLLPPVLLTPLTTNGLVFVPSPSRRRGRTSIDTTSSTTFGSKVTRDQGASVSNEKKGGLTLMMLYMRVKGRPEGRSFYDTSGDVGIIINTKALVPGSFKWTERPDGTLLVSFRTDATFHVVRKNTDPRKDPYYQG